MIGFIGFGRMGSALAKGSVAAGALNPNQILGFDRVAQIRGQIKKFKAHVAKNEADVVRNSNLVFLCVKPQGMKDAVESVTRELSQKEIERCCFVSIAAGIPIDRLQGWLGKRVSILRVMPNTPALLGAGMSAVSRGAFATKSQEARVTKILAAVGRVVSVPEKSMDAVTAISGSGPAYVFYLAEALIQGARTLRLSSTVARELVHQTIFGAGKMLAEREEESQELRRQVTSPGGTTEAAVRIFDKKNLKQIVVQATKSAAQRSAQLAKN